MIFINVWFWISLLVFLFVFYKVKGNLQWILLLGMSIFWYCSYAGVYSVYLFTTIIVTWLVGIGIQKFQSKNKEILLAGIVINIGILITLKYSGFLLGIENSFVVPLGLSFYTFQAVGYCIDTQRAVCGPERNLAKHALFLSFFPQMLTGPISRKDDLGKTLFTEKRFDYGQVVSGLYRIGMGLCKKIVISDNIGVLVDRAYGQFTVCTGMELIIVLMLYVAQLYTDFSGCIDIAIGISELFGIRLPENFDHPFSSHSVSEFWRRWHITLGSWVRDYIFYPLLKTQVIAELQKVIKKRTGKRFAKNISTWICLFVLWTTVGLWHGADWKYIIGTGLLYWTVIVGGELLKPIFSKLKKLLSIDDKTNGWRRWQSLRTFLIFCIGGIFFRSDSMSMVWDVMEQIVSQIFRNPLQDKALLTLIPFGREKLRVLIGLAGLVIFCLLSCKKQLEWRKWLRCRPFIIRWSIYFICLGLLLASFILQNGGFGEGASFIYMQF